MSLPPGTRLGPYELLALAGSGGMGEVYKARDTRLDRVVAIKILAATLATDPEFRERFDREARAVSALDHPHICALYDVGEHGGTAFLVMQYLEGESLADRLSRGALPLDDALSIAMQIAGALDRAHRAGIVHRDLKPGNIVITKSGAKLLDFGLAKHGAARTGVAAVAQGFSPADLTATPTIHAPLTQSGTLLGTFQYMAPEQIEGPEADARTDIFAFGVVLYEMVTGKKAFTGKSQASLIGAIMSTDPPPMSTLQPLTPAALDRVVRKCLAKDPESRWQTARDLGDELQWLANSRGAASSTAAATTAASAPRAWKIAAVVCGLVALTLGGREAYRLVRPAETTAVTRFQVNPPEKLSFLAAVTRQGSNSGTISPDGTRLVFSATDMGGSSQLWVRSLDSFTARPLAGTEGGAAPFWSTDSRFIGFFVDSRLKKIDANGGSAQTICDIVGPEPRGGAWSSGGLILIGTSNSSILSVPAAGGQAKPVTTRSDQRGEVNHRWPSFLPDGRHFLYSVYSTSEQVRGVYIGEIDTGVTAKLVGSDTNALYVPQGFLLFGRDGTLLRQTFDAKGLRLSGDPAPLMEHVAYDMLTGLGGFSASANGVLTFRTGTPQNTQFAWFDRTGRRLETIGPPGICTQPALSPDGTRVAFDRRDERTADDIWSLDLSRATMTRLTFGPGSARGPAWSADGSKIAYTSAEGGVVGLYEKSVSGTDAARRLYASQATNISAIVAEQFSPDGKYLLFFGTLSTATGNDVYVLPLIPDGKPTAVVQTPFTDAETQFSPDGRWLAYYTMETGRREIYVQPFPATGARWQISNNGGRQPMWRPDGRELFYVTEDRKLYGVDVHASSRFEYGTPRYLFDLRANVTSVTRSYAPSRDGQRFLVNMLLDTTESPINVVVNWTAELKK